MKGGRVSLLRASRQGPRMPAGLLNKTPAL